MTIKEFMRTVLDLGYVGVTDLSGVTRVQPSTPTTPHLGCLFSISFCDGCLIRPGHMEGRVLVDIEGTTPMYLLRVP
jgi:hypothetical protein